MSVFKIAWRSIQHRGVGSVLTILSMALGVMMVVAVLSIYGMVQKTFRSNNSFGYNMIVGARGGGLQLTMNSVYYLSQPVENIPYEYYLAFCDQPTREKELKRSIGYQSRLSAEQTTPLDDGLVMPGGFFASLIAETITEDVFELHQDRAMGLGDAGLYRRWTHMAVPLALGDSYVDPASGEAFRCVGTKPSFFSDIVLDVDTEETFSFSQGRAFVEDSPEHGFFECVIGKTVSNRTGLKLGDRIQATHGDPNAESAHIHEQEYTIVGILNSTNTANDRAVFLNMEGFFLMEDHAKSVEDDSVLKSQIRDDSPEPVDESPNGEANLIVDPFVDETFEEAMASVEHFSAGASKKNSTDESAAGDQKWSNDNTKKEIAQSDDNPSVLPAVGRDARIPLPIEQREVTSVLVRTSKNDKAGVLSLLLPKKINEGDLETTLNWTPFRPERSQKASQAVNPVGEVTKLFTAFVGPIRNLLLLLTSMICVVSALSIIVGIYNSMNQRQGEIAVMRALGASRAKVMTIILCEAILLAVVGGFVGWIAGHGLNAALGPLIEARTGVEIGFFDFAPGSPLQWLPGGQFLPTWLGRLTISPEFLIIPALMILAVLVGIYPARSAYKTDVSKALGK
jgi:putative ABC transport system permease protein